MGREKKKIHTQKVKPVNFESSIPGAGKTKKKVDVESGAMDRAHEIAQEKTNKRMGISDFVKNKILTVVTAIVGGILGTGGGIFAGFDTDYAVLVGLTALVLIASGKESAAFFYELVHKPKKK
ncbi:MAG: hypothetical protein ACOCTM_01855 [Bacteroidota bacterium]